MSKPEDPRPLLSVVSPLFNEEGNVEPLVTELHAELRPLTEAYEIILVDDGSRDDTWDKIEEAHRQDGRVKGLRLLRNFGHQGALLAGLEHASGRAVVTMDGDLQHPPSKITDLLAAWRQGAKVVHTLRQDSADTGAFKRWTSRAFYRVFSALSGFPVPPGSSDFRLLDAEILGVLLHMRDPEPFLRGAIHWIGCPSADVVYQARERASGSSKFNLKRMVRLSVTGLVSFSTVPLRLGIWVGIVTAALAFAEIVYIVVQYFRGNTVPGWASMLTVVSFMFGILFILLGILGTYLGSIHQALKNRPTFLVARQVGWSEAGASRLREAR